jgi:hypothetical protein
MEEHYTGCQQSTPFVLHGPTQFVSVSQYTSDVTVVPCCMNYTISTTFPSQKIGVIRFLADICLNLFSLLGECMCIQCFNCSMASTFKNENQVSSPLTQTMWLRNSSPALWYCSKKSQSWNHSVFCAHPWAFSEPILHKTCDSLACNLIDNNAWNLWKFTEIMKHCLSQMFWPTLQTGAHSSAVGWGTLLKALRSWVWFPMGVTEFFFSIYLILPAAIWPWSRFSL